MVNRRPIDRLIPVVDPERSDYFDWPEAVGFLLNEGWSQVAVFKWSQIVLSYRECTLKAAIEARRN